MRFIDCHTHLYSEQFEKDRADVIEIAKTNGVCGALLCAENIDNLDKIIQLSDQFADFCFPCFGVHPVQGNLETKEARSVELKDLELIIPWIEKHHEKLVAIGECGLDFTPHWCKTDKDKEEQRAVLKAQVELAKKYSLPLNVHSRSAGRPTIALLKECGAENVLMHAFDGKASVALQGVECGYYFSIPPSIVRSEQKSKLVEKVPLENLLLETDSPALGPVRDERNVPSNVQLSCEYIAKVKGVSAETVAKITWENSVKLFPKILNYLPK